MSVAARKTAFAVSAGNFYCRSDPECTFTKSARARIFGRLWYGEPNAISNAIDYAKFRSRSYRAVIRVHDETGNVIETHEHAGDFKE
jgi:hypothetical protein